MFTRSTRRRWRAGDPLMPLLFSLAQHSALSAVHERFNEGEHLFAFHDDLYTVCLPERVGELHRVLAHELAAQAHIALHHGKTKVWNRGGHEPPACIALQARARLSDEDATVWRGNHTLPNEIQGIKILGTPVGQVEFVRHHLATKTAKHAVLFSRIPAIQDLQAAWLSSCTLPQRSPIFSSGQWHLISQRSMHLHMTVRCGSVVGRFYTSVSTPPHRHRRLLPFL